MSAVATTSGSCPVCGRGRRSQIVATGRDFEYATTPQEFSVHECTDCGSMFLDPRPVDDAIAALYPPEYGPYHADELPTVVRRARAVVQGRKASLIKRLVGSDATVLDLGCGAGALLLLLRDRGMTGELIGWDFPGPHLEHVRKQGFGVLDAPIDIEHAPRAIADIVVLNQVIEHFAEPREVLRIARAVLRPGGFVFIETPDVTGLDAKLFRRRYWGGYHFPRHLVLFHQESLRRLLEQEGFQVRKVEYLPSPTFWNQSVHHALTEKRVGRKLAGFFVVENPLTMGAATVFDAVAAKVARTSNLRMVAVLHVAA